MKKLNFLMLNVFVFIATIFHLSSARSFIQIETGQLFHEMVDFELTNGNFPLIISRQYQQLKSGISILGDRWCFDFEQQMRPEDGGYRLYSCGNPTAVFFSIKDKKLSYENEKMFEKKNGGLLRRTNNQLTYVYNTNGFLAAKYRSGTKTNTVKISYDKEHRPIKISYLDKYLLEFKLDAKGKATGLFSKGKKVVNYVVINNKLVAEKNVWGIEHQFQYNELGLLSKITYPDNTTEKFTYNSGTKTVEDFVSKDGCVRKFDYNLDAAKATAKLTLKDSCIKLPPIQITLKRSNLFHKNRVSKLAEKNNKKKKSSLLVQRDQFNRVQRIENANYFWTIGYNQKSGALNSITENIKSSKISKTYNVVYRYNKIVEISEPGRSKINFVYSKKGKLLRVRSTARPEERLVLMTKVDQIRSIIEDSTL